MIERACRGRSWRRGEERADVVLVEAMVMVAAEMKADELARGRVAVVAAVPCLLVAPPHAVGLHLEVTAPHDACESQTCGCSLAGPGLQPGASWRGPRRAAAATPSLQAAGAVLWAVQERLELPAASRRAHVVVA